MGANPQYHVAPEQPKASFVDDQEIRKLDELARSVLHTVAEGRHGVTQREVQEGLSTTYTKAKNRLRLLEELNLARREEIPHQNPKMPPTYVYYPTAQGSEAAKFFEKTKLSEEDSSSASEDEPLLLSGKFGTQKELESPVSEPFQSITVKECLSSMRPSARTSHIEVLEVIAVHGALSMGDVAEILDRRTQTVHSQLGRLIEFGLLAREKREKETGSGTEYVYFLVPELDANDVQSLSLVKPAPSTEVLEVETMASPAQQSTDSDVQVHQVHEQSNVESAPKLPSLTPLPEFNDNWPHAMQEKWLDVQGKWLDTFAKLLERSSGNN